MQSLRILVAKLFDVNHFQKVELERPDEHINFFLPTQFQLG
jgi:hypothetical protein